jgi:hypothetical protein
MGTISTRVIGFTAMRLIILVLSILASSLTANCYNLPAPYCVRQKLL